jgi:protein DGCR14
MSSEATEPSAPSERSLNSQVVLEEDEYTEALSRIIARDFFPSLVQLDATNEYLDALRTRDPHLIGASVRRLEEVSQTPTPGPSRRWLPSQTPSQTPFGLASETPLYQDTRSEPPSKRPKYDTDMSLDEFQARYTSEDNSSFTRILDEENHVRKEKWGWAWDAQKRIEGRQAKLIEDRQQMLLEAPGVPGVREQFKIEAPKPPGLIKDVEENKEEENSESEDTDGKALVSAGKRKASEESVQDVMAPQKDTRPAGVDGWNFKVCLFHYAFSPR